ncbi:MAG TPA: S-methyl-5'-thioadenosine phosphorylase [Acidimicrobiia bacterium]|jgi:5'-methylthioadenosine phosphorylase
MIGVFGGSGFYEFLDDARSVEVETPYGAPAAPYTVGTVSGVEVAFLPRHGADHRFPAHMVPYKANVWGMRQLGASCLIGPCAVGSLKTEIEPGDFVVCDQLVDWTRGRARTYFDGPDIEHLSFADPYCEDLRRVAIESLEGVDARVHDGGAVVVIEGPRFSSRAESSFFSSHGWAVINMTQEPEVALSRELGMCYVNISVVTDYDAGVVAEAEPVTHAQVLKQFEASLDTLRAAVVDMIPRVDATHSCRGSIQE